jgi:DUF1680 family protein
LIARENEMTAPQHQRRPDAFGDPLAEVDYGEVRLADGPHRVQLEHTHAVLMGLDEDSLLRPFRLKADLPTPGFELGGWYSSNGRDPGHSFGQWLSALSRYAAITGDRATREKVVRLVAGFAETVEPEGRFYRNYGHFDEGTYTYNMLVRGLSDAHHHVGAPGALDALDRTTDAILPLIADNVAEDARYDDWCMMLPENQFTAWQQGATERYLELGERYLHTHFLGPLARGVDVLPGRHAYGHVAVLAGAAKAYLALGHPDHLAAAVNGMAFVDAQTFVTGGFGPGETFLPIAPVEKDGVIVHSGVADRADSIEKGTLHFETICSSYAYLTLARYLLRITKDSTYGDRMERLIHNGVLGALPLNPLGKAFYQSNYHSPAWKEYFDGYGHVMDDAWPCCSGTLPLVAADYHVNAYLRDDDGVYLNLYIPSTLTFEQDGGPVTITQSGEYPLTDSVHVAVDPIRPTDFALRIRVPGWSLNPSVTVNGEPVEDVHPGTFLTVRRTWTVGDQVELRFPAALRLEAADPAHPDLVALVHGSLVLFADAADAPRPNGAELLAATQSEPGAGTWVAPTAAGAVRLRPWWFIQRHELYRTYMKVDPENH